MIPHVELDELQHLVKQEADAKQARRYLAIIHTYRTNYYPKCPEIATLLQVAKRTVYTWISAWKEGIVEGIRLGAPPGRDSKLSQEQQEYLFEVVQTNPRDHGFEFSTGTLKAIASYIEIEFGVELSISAIHQMLTKNKIVLVNPRPMPAKADPEKNKNL